MFRRTRSSPSTSTLSTRSYTAARRASARPAAITTGCSPSRRGTACVYKKYGDESEQTVQQQPYRLASDVWGIGFKTADTIAASVGIAMDSPERIKAGLAYTLSEAADDGRCYLPEPRLVTDAARILEVPAELIAPRVADLAAEEGAVIETLPVPSAAAAEPLRAVCLPPFFHAERSLAAALRNLLTAGKDRLPAFQSVEWDKALGWLKTRTGADLAPEQAEAVRRFGLADSLPELQAQPKLGSNRPAPWPD